MNSHQPLKTNPILAGGTPGAGRFQVLVEYAPGVFVSTASAEKIEDAVEFFLKQFPGCEAGKVALLDRNERRVIGSVKWKVEPTENGLRVPYRHNLFCDWNTALVALEVQIPIFLILQEVLEKGQKDDSPYVSRSRRRCIG